MCCGYYMIQKKKKVSKSHNNLSSHGSHMKMIKSSNEKEKTENWIIFQLEKIIYGKLHVI